jgi:hypothetical protein
MVRLHVLRDPAVRNRLFPAWILHRNSLGNKTGKIRSVFGGGQVALDHARFLEELLLDLKIEAERDCPKKDYSSHPGPWRPNSLEPKEPYTCPKCNYFHATAYIKGQKPKRCYRCHTPLNKSEIIGALTETGK